MDDTAATAIMQRFGKAYFNRDRALLADVQDRIWLYTNR